MDKWIELQRFYELYKSLSNDADDIGFTFSDNKHHLFIYKTNEYSDSDDYEWYIEVNKIADDGDMVPTDTTFAPVNDDACLMVQVAWCIDRFLGEED